MKDYSNDNSIGPFDLLIGSLANIETLLLDYQIQVPSYITKGGFQNGSSGESESKELKEALLEAVQTWVEAKSNDLSQVGNDTMLPDTDRVQYMNVTTAVCNTDTSTQNTNTQPDDKCLAIQMAIPLQLSGVHSLTPDEIKATFQPKFDEALKDGSFVALLPPEVQNDILGVSPSLPGNDSPPQAEAAPTPVVAPAPQQAVTSPSILVSLKAPELSSVTTGIAAGVSIGLVVIIAGFFGFKRLRMQKKRLDNADSTPSFGKRDSYETQSSNEGILSAFAPEKGEIRSDDLEWGQDPIQERSNGESDSSSHSSGSHSNSMLPPVLHRVTKSIPTLFSAASNEEYPGNLPQPVNTSLTSGNKSSSSSENEKPAEVEKTLCQLFIDSAGNDLHELLSDQAAAGADDDSSAGSSGWESSDGDSSMTVENA